MCISCALQCNWNAFRTAGQISSALPPRAIPGEALPFPAPSLAASTDEGRFSLDYRSAQAIALFSRYWRSIAMFFMLAGRGHQRRRHDRHGMQREPDLATRTGAGACSSRLTRLPARSSKRRKSADPRRSTSLKSSGTRAISVLPPPARPRLFLPLRHY